MTLDDTPECIEDLNLDKRFLLADDGQDWNLINSGMIYESQKLI